MLLYVCMCELLHFGHKILQISVCALSILLFGQALYYKNSHPRGFVQKLNLCFCGICETSIIFLFANSHLHETCI